MDKYKVSYIDGFGNLCHTVYEAGSAAEAAKKCEADHDFADVLLVSLFE